MKPQFLKWVSRAASLAAIAPILSAAVFSQTTPPSSSSEFWAETRLVGQSSGSYHEKSELGPHNDVLTSTDTDITINRLGSKVEIKASVQYDETADGRLAGLKSDMSSSNQSVHMDVVVKDNSLAIQTTSGGKSYDRTLPTDGNVIGPEAVRKLTLARLKSPGDTLSYQMFLPQTGTIAKVTRTFVGPADLKVGDNTVPALKVEEVIQDMPGKDTVWLDANGRLLRDLADTPFGQMENIRAPREQVQQAEMSPGTLPAEAFTRTVANSNIRLPHDRYVEEIKVRLTHRKPELGWPDFTADNQTVLEKTANTVVLEIRRPQPNSASPRPVTSTAELTPYLQPNPLIQSDDPNVQKIAREVVGNQHDLMRAAYALQGWTAAHMQFDAGIAIVPASEVVRDRRGTCFGYAILLSSLARASGIPSRIRMGYAYAAGAWGGHAWVEVLNGQQWIPLDAALYAPQPSDAARFSVITTALESGTVSQVGELAKLFGNVDIQILEYKVDGRTTVVASDAKPFITTGNTYSNPWLGVSITKPEGFEFRNLDAGWPNLAVVTMQSADGKTIELTQAEQRPGDNNDPRSWYLQRMEITGDSSKKRIANEQALEVTSPDKSGLALTHGGDIWMLKSTGSNSQELLNQVAATLSFSSPSTQ